MITLLIILLAVLLGILVLLGAIAIPVFIAIGRVLLVCFLIRLAWWLLFGKKIGES